jgi:hypothetical protein
VAAEVFGGGVSAMLEGLTEFIPDNHERKAFTEQLVEDYKSGKHHISFCTHGLWPSI